MLAIRYGVDVVSPAPPFRCSQGMLGQGREAVDFIVEQHGLHGRDLWPADGITRHTANAAARDQMTRAIERWAPKLHRVRRTLTPDGKRQFLFSAR